jgi:hypothetical protein
VTLATKITALLTSLTLGQLQALNHADRMRLADQCDRVSRLLKGPATGRAADAPPVGVIDGRGRE